MLKLCLIWLIVSNLASLVFYYRGYRRGIQRFFEYGFREGMLAQIHEFEARAPKLFKQYRQMMSGQPLPMGFVDTSKKEQVN